MSDFKGLVLTNTIIHDADVLMTVLTDEGKISIKARGVLKLNSKNRSMTETGCYSLFHTIDRMNQKVYLLKNAEIERRFPNIEKDLVKKTIYSCILEALNKVDISLNEALNIVERLNDSNCPFCLYAYFLCKLMKDSGISLVVDECVNCGSQSKLCGLSIQDGGFVCLSCFDSAKHHQLSVFELKNLRYCMHANIKDYSILEENTCVSFDTIRLLIKFYERYGDISIKSHAFLEMIEPLG